MKIIIESDLSKIKDEVWRKLEMPHTEDAPLKEQINDVQSELHLNHEKLAEELSDIQKEHKQILMDVISRGDKVEYLEGRDPLVEFIETKGKYPFDKQ